MGWRCCRSGRTRPWFWWRRVVDHCLAGQWCSKALRRQLYHFELALMAAVTNMHVIPDPEQFRRLGSGSVDRDLPGAARGCGLGAGTKDPHRPQPHVGAYRSCGIRTCWIRHRCSIRSLVRTHHTPTARKWMAGKIDEAPGIGPEPNPRGLRVRFRVHPYRPRRYYRLNRLHHCPVGLGPAGQFALGFLHQPKPVRWLPAPPPRPRA